VTVREFDNEGRVANWTYGGFPECRTLCIISFIFNAMSSPKPTSAKFHLHKITYSQWCGPVVIPAPNFGIGVDSETC